MGQDAATEWLRFKIAVGKIQEDLGMDRTVRIRDFERLGIIDEDHRRNFK